MANKRAAQKDAVRAACRAAEGHAVRSKLRTLARKVSTLVGTSSNDAKGAASQYASELDKAVKKGVIHRNAANRRKGFLSKVIFG
jgi:small subunit ribosomal protein S20